MIYAPIMIPTLCRSEHFIRCIESLKKNTWASNTDVYIALDYPAKESHWKGYQEICEYLKGDFSCFANFQVFKRTENYGAGKNNRVMLQWILERYDRYIRTDDDIEFSPNFLEYMDKCLMEYEEDTDVVAVSGYSYPIEWKVSEGSTALKIDCCCSMWGTGFWKNKREQLIQAIETGDFFRQNAGEFIKLGKVNQLSDARKTDFAGALTDKESLAHRMSDVAIGTYLGFAEKSVIIPAISKSRNHGFDGTGEWCPMVEKKENVMVSARNYNYKEQPFDENLNFNLIPDTLNNMEENRRRYNRFDTRSEKEINHANTKIRLYKYAGGAGITRYCA